MSADSSFSEAATDNAAAVPQGIFLLMVNQNFTNSYKKSENKLTNSSYFKNLNVSFSIIRDRIMNYIPTSLLI